MRYLEWCEFRDNNIYVKRASNKKWYNAIDLLEQICNFVNTSDRCNLLTEFSYEFSEIKKSYQFLWIDFPKWYVLITDRSKFKYQKDKIIKDDSIFEDEEEEDDDDED